ncbi:hypothetical protein MMC24_007930 [Lignoscripta atroalba]|nr:hypothetical protein [Lignoscripta atroalba]
MASTYFPHIEAQKTVKAGKVLLAKGHKWTEQAGFGEEPYTELQQFSSAIGLVTNAVDSVKWLQVVIDKSAALPAKGHAALTAPRLIVDHNIHLPKSGYFASADVPWRRNGFPRRPCAWLRRPNGPHRKFGFAVLSNANSKAVSQVGFRLLKDS